MVDVGMRDRDRRQVTVSGATRALDLPAELPGPAGHARVDEDESLPPVDQVGIRDRMRQLEDAPDDASTDHPRHPTTPQRRVPRDLSHGVASGRSSDLDVP